MEGWPRAKGQFGTEGVPRTSTALCQLWISCGAMGGTLLGLAWGCCSSPVLSSLARPHSSLPYSQGTAGSHRVCSGNKEGAAALSGQHHALSVGAGPFLQQQLPIIPRITACSQLAGTHRTMEPHSEAGAH